MSAVVRTEANSNCGGGGLIVPVSCGREQIRIWIVLRGEAEGVPTPTLPPMDTSNPQLYTHKHTL